MLGGSPYFCIIVCSPYFYTIKVMQENNRAKLYLREPYFSDILSGQKTIEGRIAKPYLRNLEIGSELRFIRNDENDIVTKVQSLHVYGTFYDMLMEENMELLLPRCSSADQGVEIYESLPKFRQQASKFGVIAIRFFLIPNSEVKK